MKIKSLFTNLINTLVIICCFGTNAAIISGTHFTNEGKQVDLQNLEWLSLHHTSGLSPLDIQGGFTDRFNNVWAAGEWQYASRAQTETLLNSLWGGVFEGFSDDNADGALWFLTHFGGLEYDIGGHGTDRINQTFTDRRTTNGEDTNFMFGSPGECPQFGNDYLCRGRVYHAERFVDSIVSRDVLTGVNRQSHARNSNLPIGFISDRLGANLGLDPINEVTVLSTRDDNWGSLLVRSTGAPLPPTQVNEPASIAILALGLLFIRLQRKNR